MSLPIPTDRSLSSPLKYRVYARRFVDSCIKASPSNRPIRISLSGEEAREDIKAVFENYGYAVSLRADDQLCADPVNLRH